MRIIPVLDVKGGIVVRGVGGRREQYQPIVSQLTSSTFPMTVAEDLREQLGLDEFYLADLDAIAGEPPDLELYRRLSSHGFRLWIDAGIRVAVDADELLDAGVSTVVAGLETLGGPSELASLCDRHGERIVFSLDLKQGKALASSMQWPLDPWDIAERAITLGARRLLLLDLSRVGEYRGLGTEELCERLARRHSEVEVSAGGGVRGVDDLRRLQLAGVSAVLVASAIHDGRLRRLEIEGVR